MTWSTEMTEGGAGMPEECRDSGECGDGGAYRSGAGGMQFFPWERQSTIGTQVGQEESSHSNPLRKYALRHTSQKHSPHLPLANRSIGVPRLADFMF